MRTYFDEIVWDRQKKKKKEVQLLQKLGPLEHEKYVNYILPKKHADISFEETILQLQKFSVIKTHFSTPVEFTIDKNGRSSAIKEIPVPKNVKT